MQHYIIRREAKFFIPFSFCSFFPPPSKLWLENFSRAKIEFSLPTRDGQNAGKKVSERTVNLLIAFVGLSLFLTRRFLQANMTWLWSFQLYIYIMLLGVLLKDANAHLFMCVFQWYPTIRFTLLQGFARYSTDAKWHVPHFEKMLYDQAQLTVAFSNAYQVHFYYTHNELCTRLLSRGQISVWQSATLLLIGTTSYSLGRRAHWIVRHSSSGVATNNTFFPQMPESPRESRLSKLAQFYQCVFRRRRRSRPIIMLP